MVDRGEFQKNMAAFMAVAKAKDLKFEEFLPEEILEHFQEMTELTTAREYIKELEDREKKLQAANETLTNDLDKKQTEIDNLPTEYQALKVDLQQAQRQIALYKETSEDAQGRVERYRCQLNNIVGRQQTDTAAAGKIEQLQTQVENQQAVINKLMIDNRKSETIFEQLRESDTKAIEQKDKQLAKKKKELAEKDKLLAELYLQVQEAYHSKAVFDDADSVYFDNTDDAETLVDELQNDILEMQQQNINLLQQNLALAEHNRALEDQNTVLQEQLRHMSQSIESTSVKDYTTQLSAAAVSETKSLNRFYEALYEVLAAFAKTFQASSQGDIPSLSHLIRQLDAAHDALDDFCTAKKVRASTGESGEVDEDQMALRKELDSMAASAAESIISIEILHSGLWSFIQQLSDDPKMLSDLNGMLCDANYVPVVDIDCCD